MRSGGERHSAAAAWSVEGWRFVTTESTRTSEARRSQTFLRPSIDRRRNGAKGGATRTREAQAASEYKLEKVRGERGKATVPIPAPCIKSTNNSSPPRPLLRHTDGVELVVGECNV